MKEDLLALIVRSGTWYMVWIETIGFTLIAVLLAFWASPDDPFFIKGQFPWIALMPALLALRYGVLSGVVSSAILIGTWLVLQAGGFDTGEFPKHYFLGILILAMICGEFCGLWNIRLRRSEYVKKHLGDRIDVLTRRYFLLRLSHDRLEEGLLEKPVTLRSALAEIRALISADQSRTLPGAPALMRLLVQYCQIETAGLYPILAGSVDPQPVAVIGEPGPLRADDALVRAAIEKGALMHLQSDDVQSDGSQYLAVAPMMNSDKRTFALLVIERMPFMAFHTENLQTLGVLLGYHADAIQRIRMAEVITRLLPDCPVLFAEEVVRLHRLWESVRVPSMLVALKFGNHPDRLAYFENLRRSLRDLDIAWEIRQDGTLVLLVLLPLTGRAGLEGYLIRIEELLMRHFGLGLDAARITPNSVALEGDGPSVTLLLLLERCGVKQP